MRPKNTLRPTQRGSANEAGIQNGAFRLAGWVRGSTLAVVLGLGILPPSVVVGQESQEPSTETVRPNPPAALPLLEPVEQNFAPGSDPFPEMTQQPPLWFCDPITEIKDKKTGETNPLPSILLESALLLEESITSKVKQEAEHRMDRAKLIADYLEKIRLFANNQKSDSEYAREYAKKLKDLEKIYEIVSKKEAPKKSKAIDEEVKRQLKQVGCDTSTEEKMGKCVAFITAKINNCDTSSEEVINQCLKKLFVEVPRQNYSEQNMERWRSVQEKMQRLIPEFKAVVDLEASAGKRHKRCAKPTEPVGVADTSWLLPMTNVIKDPALYTEYDVLPEAIRPAPYLCYPKYNSKDPKAVGAPIIEMTKYLQSIIEQHLEAALRRSKVYYAAEQGYDANKSDPKKGGRMRFIAFENRQQNDDDVRRLKKLLDGILEIKSDIISASNEESKMAQKLKRCKKD